MGFDNGVNLAFFEAWATSLSYTFSFILILVGIVI